MNPRHPLTNRLQQRPYCSHLVSALNSSNCSRYSYDSFLFISALQVIPNAIKINLITGISKCLTCLNASCCFNIQKNHCFCNEKLVFTLRASVTFSLQVWKYVAKEENVILMLEKNECYMWSTEYLLNHSRAAK